MKDYKKYIFDMDYTLVEPDWSMEDDYFRSCIKKEEQDLFFKLKQDIIDKYEKESPRYDIKTLSDYFKDYSLDVSEDIIYGWLIYNGEKIVDKVYDGVIDLFKYLKDNGKEIVVLTNWFSVTQIERLKRCGLLKYIDKVICGDDSMKPNRDSFMMAIGDSLKKDCIMIGDGVDTDKVGAQNVGIDYYIVSDDNSIRDLYNLIVNDKNII